MIAHALKFLVAIRYILQFCEMSSCWGMIGQTKATLIGCMNKVTHQGAAVGARSDIYDYLVLVVHY